MMYSSRSWFYPGLIATLVFALVALSAQRVSAATCTWNGTEGNWNDASKWSCASVPGANDAAVLNGGTVTVTAAVNVGDLTVTAGSLRASAALTVSHGFTWTAGTLSGAGPATIPPGAVLTFNNPTLDGLTLTNHGAATWAPGYPNLVNGAVFNNAADGLLTIVATGQTWSGDGTTGIINAGRIVKVGGDLVPVNPPLANSGVVTVSAGTLYLAGAGNHSGPFAVAVGGTLRMVASQNFGAGANLTGGGTADFLGGTSVITATYDMSTTLVSGGTLRLVSGKGVVLPDVVMTGGTLTGSDALTVSHGFTWTAGTLSGAGPVTILPGGALTLNSPTLDGRVLTNHGTATWVPGYPNLVNGAIFNNAADGVLTIVSTGQTWFGDASTRLSNSGTLMRSGSPTAVIGTPFTNDGSVTLTDASLQFNSTYSQTGGTTALTNSTIIMNSVLPFDLDGGVLRGAGAINGSLLQRGGVVAPGNSPGVLHVTGNFAQEAAGQVQIEVGGLISGTQYDLLDVDGGATLNGTLNVTLINGFTPSVGNTFRVMNYGSRSGTFSSVLGGYPAPGLAFTPIYNTDNLTLWTMKLLFLPLIIR